MTSLDPSPTIEELKDFYATTYRKESNEEQVTPTVLEYEQKRADRILPIIDRIPDFAPTNILDIGCSTGVLLRNFQQKWQDASYFGIELNEKYQKHIVANDTLQDDSLFNKPIEELPDTIQDMDLVTLVHVLEHVHNPLETVEEIYSRMRTGGYFYIEVPNLNTPYFKLVGNYFIQYHLHYFNDFTLKALLEKAGFNIVEKNKQAGTSISYLCQKPSSPEKGKKVTYPSYLELVKRLNQYRYFKYPVYNTLVKLSRWTGILALKKRLLN
jgi:SAM-dependent methyltransferase